MKTENTEQNQLTETSVTLSIPSCVAGNTLKGIQDKDIKCEYFGIKENGDLLMKLSYFDWQEPHLKKIISEMKDGETQMQLLFLIVGKIAIDSYVNQQLSEILSKKPIEKYHRRRKHNTYNGSN